MSASADQNDVYSYNIVPDYNENGFDDYIILYDWYKLISIGKSIYISSDKYEYINVYVTKYV